METARQPTIELPIRSTRVDVVAGPDSGASRDTVESCSIGTAASNDLVLTDAAVSRYHLEVVARHDGMLVVDHGSTNGTWIGGVRVERAVVPPGTVLRVGGSQVRIGEAPSSQVAIHAGESLGPMVGRSPAMRRLFAQIERAAQSDASVLVTGESGTGKELVARALHDLGPRRGMPFVVVDCGAVAPTLIASELFGHEKGAFTGADRQHVGALESAHRGTLFFDEIGELPATLQASLLGALQRRRFKRIGGRKEVEIDVRVVSATHRDLRAEVNASTFRLDLFYRLAVVVLQVPPLRERLEDVPLLVERFVRDAGHEGDVAELFSAEALRALSAQRWPGNVRELQNLIEATMAMGELPTAIAGDPGSADAAHPGSILPYRAARDRVLADFERGYLSRLHAQAGGNVSRAAREARMDRSHLIELLRKHGIK
jgi:DNA-binding NtrC family response regulator